MIQGIVVGVFFLTILIYWWFFAALIIWNNWRFA